MPEKEKSIPKFYSQDVGDMGYKINQSINQIKHTFLLLTEQSIAPP